MTPRELVEATAQRWNPSHGWASTVAPLAEIISSGEARDGAEVLRAWCDLAMTFGDTRAPALALIVCLHAEATAPAGLDLSRVRMHRNLCLLDLQIAGGPAQVPIAELANVVEETPPGLDAWLADAIAGFDGDLARAAQFALALAVSRLGIAGGSGSR
jgi:hypothetical protein